MSTNPHQHRAQWPVEVQEKLGELEEQHRRAPHDRGIMMKIARFLLAQEDLGEAQKYLRRASMGILQDKSAHSMIVQLGMLYIQAWQTLKSANFGKMDEIYMGEERQFLLLQAMGFLNQAVIMEETKHDPDILIQVSLCKEYNGELGEALALLSDIIQNHQDFSGLFVAVFRSAVILHHAQDFEKSKEYLEYLGDLELTGIGISYSIYYAEIISMYEDYAEANKGMAKKLQSQLKGAYMDLQKWYVQERRDLDEEKYGGIRRMSKEEFQRSPIVWIELALESLHLSNYLVAIHFLIQAVSRLQDAELFVLLSESFWMLKQMDRAIAMMEKAYELDSNNARIHQLLKRWAPLKWASKFENEPEDIPDSMNLVSRRHLSLSPTKGFYPVQPDKEQKCLVKQHKKVAPERSLFRTIEEEDVRRLLRRAMENKMFYTQENAVFKVLAKFKESKTKYDIRNTRVRLSKRYSKSGHM